MQKQSVYVYFMTGIVSIALFYGCATIEDAVNAKHEGTSQVYDISPEEAWAVAKTVLQWEEAENLEEHKDQNYLTASMGISAFSNGVVIAVWVRNLEKNMLKLLWSLRDEPRLISPQASPRVRFSRGLPKLSIFLGPANLYQTLLLRRFLLRRLNNWQTL